MTLTPRLFSVTHWGVLIAALALPLPLGEEASRGHRSAPETLAVPPEGRDDRSLPVEQGRLSPYAAVGRLTGTMVCTAAIVLHPRLIVTAAHCVTGRDGLASRATAAFQPARRAASELDRFEATLWALGSQQRFAAQSAWDAANDWAILVLDRVPAGVRPLRVRSPSLGDLRQLERQVLMPGYAIDGAGTLALNIDRTCSVRGLEWNVLLHDCQASPGASGAPLLIRDRNWYAVVGIHSGSLLAVDPESGVPTFAGHSAIGTWAFADALAKVERRLKGGDGSAVAAALAH